MKKRYVVHSVTTDPIELELEHKGAKVPALVQGVTVELVDPEGGPSITIRHVPSSEKEVEMFAEDAAVTVSFSAAK